MEKQEKGFHGSDIEKIEKIYGIKKEEIINFSANVNPLGIPPLLLETLSANMDAIAAYPDREYTALRKEIAAYAGTDYRNVAVGNGSTELISLFIRTAKPKKSLVLAPTYSEYEREITLEGGMCRYYALQEENGFQLDMGHFMKELTPDLDLVILCNPNNPTSTLIHRDDMEEILKGCRQKGIFVLVDETYMEFVDHYQDVTAVPLAKAYENLVVLRGTSKFFAVPGLRLGYAVMGSQTALLNLCRLQNPWSLHSLAAAAGGAMFQDEAYIEQTQRLIAGERERMYQKFLGMEGFRAYRPKANFMLVKICGGKASSGEMAAWAMREKMMIRDCSDFLCLGEGYLRFCFLEAEKNDRLAECLKRGFF